MSTHTVKAGPSKGKKVSITGSHSQEKAWTRRPHQEADVLRQKTNLSLNPGATQEANDTEGEDE